MRRRLAITAAAVTAMVVVAFCVPLALIVQVVARDRAVHSAELESRSLAAVLSGTRDPFVLGPIIERANAGSERPATVYLPDGTVIGPGGAPDASLDKARTGQAYTEDAGDGRSLFLPVQSADGVAVVLVRVPADLLHRGVYTAWLLLATLGVALVLLAVALADRFGHSFVSPMQQLRDVAHRLREGDREARTTVDGPEEVTEVADALNRLADRIDELVAAEREAAADLSHRLRTPLTALRLDVDRLPDPDARARLAEEVAAVEHAVDELIRSARSTPSPKAECVDIVSAVRERMRFWSVLAENQDRTVDLHLADDPIVVAVSRDDIDAAVDALIGNVFAHTAEGVGFRVEVHAPANGAPAVLVVEDDGGGLGNTEVISRGASGTGSTGLGLDITRRTAEAGGGELRLGTGESGGTRVEVVLAVAAPEPLSRR